VANLAVDQAVNQDCYREEFAVRLLIGFGYHF